MITLHEAAQTALNAWEIDHGVGGAMRQLEQVLAQPHTDYPCRRDGRCQYAIDSGAEGLGHCPRGKCVMADRA